MGYPKKRANRDAFYLYGGSVIVLMVVCVVAIVVLGNRGGAQESRFQDRGSSVAVGGPGGEFQVERQSESRPSGNVIRRQRAPGPSDNSGSVILFLFGGFACFVTFGLMAVLAVGIVIYLAIFRWQVKTAKRWWNEPDK